MNPGSLRSLINIESKAGSTPDGFGNSVQRWCVAFAAVPATVQAYSAREQWAASAAQSETTHRVTIRYMDGLDTTMRLTYNGRIFNIAGIAPDDEERRIMIVLDCKEDFSPDQKAIGVQQMTGIARIVVTE